MITQFETLNIITGECNKMGRRKFNSREAFEDLEDKYMGWKVNRTILRKYFSLMGNSYEYNDESNPKIDLRLIIELDKDQQIESISWLKIEVESNNYGHGRPHNVEVELNKKNIDEFTKILKELVTEEEPNVDVSEDSAARKQDVSQDQEAIKHAIVISDLESIENYIEKNNFYKDSKEVSNIAQNAVSKGRTDILEYLLSIGFDINKPFKLGLTLLHKACISQELEMCKFLIDNGADVNAKGELLGKGYTPMMAACHGILYDLPTREIVELLVKSGADPRAVNENGASAKDFAKSRMWEFRETAQKVLNFLNENT
jgi:hypothetical protein